MRSAVKHMRSVLESDHNHCGRSMQGSEITSSYIGERARTTRVLLQRQRRSCLAARRGICRSGTCNKVIFSICARSKNPPYSRAPTVLVHSEMSTRQTYVV